MTAQTWSISGLSTELGVDRRTIARRLDHHAVEPAGAGPKGPVYRMRDAFSAITAWCSDCGWLERDDDSARSFFRHFEEDGRAEALLARLDAAPPDGRLRALREHFASMLWSAIAGDLDEPEWSALGPKTFEQTWRALAEGASLDDVLALSRAEWPRTWWGPNDADAVPEFREAFEAMQLEAGERAST